MEDVLYRPELPGDEQALESMNAAIFGPGRFARTAYRIRESAAHDPALSRVALIDGEIVGGVRLTPITIGPTPALLLGPLAVTPAHRSHAIGATLMRASMEAAREAGHRLVLLVGDLPYYHPFGFRPATATVSLPGPVDRGRLLIAELVGGAALGLAGMARAPSGAVPAGG